MDKQSRAGSTLFTAPGRYDAFSLIICVKIETFQPRFFSSLGLCLKMPAYISDKFPSWFIASQLLQFYSSLLVSFSLSHWWSIFKHITERLIELKVVYNEFAWNINK